MTDDHFQRISVFTNTLMFETPGGQRYTQDSPILPNVWLAYAHEPRSQQELILTANHVSGTGDAARRLRAMLKSLRKKRPMVGDKDPIPRQRARVSYIPGQIAVKLYFDELLRVVLPLTPWWHETYDTLRKIEHEYRETADAADWVPFPQADPEGKRERDLVDALMLMRREIDPAAAGANGWPTHQDRTSYIREIPADLSWLVRIAGLIADCFNNGTELLEGETSPSTMLNHDFQARKHDRIERTQEREERMKGVRIDHAEALMARIGLVDALTQLYDNWCPAEDYPSDRHIWRVTKNRRVHLAVAKSALTVKADAARHLFNVSCRNITWAVLDSGIDAAHPAFKLTTEEHELEVRRELASEFEERAKENKIDPAQLPDLVDTNGLARNVPVDRLKSRISKTLDFTRLRELLDVDVDLDPTDAEARKREEKLERDIAGRMAMHGGDAGSKPSKDDLKKAAALLKRLKDRIEDGKEISWQDLEGAIVVNDPTTPTNDHGTHVAGILGADWIEDFKSEEELPLNLRKRRMTGICPDINIVDVRVFREDGLTDEFELLAALQFLRWMNSRAGSMQIHGANLSLSLVHEVRRFACGQTPICDECNEAAALGIVVVAAAGNRGFEMNDLEEVRASDSYKSVSITDPGNAASVITVGATHRKRPHEYGVSYFSSRGPTGDGRLKPDLVAPGEKIKGPTPNRRAEYKDGTSMAAPHVSGAAAMLMARHSELVGQPARIKQILCDTATDLGRERYFQGHGLVDTLRALQSV